MKSNPLIWIGMIVGSTLGGLIPNLWGAGLFSFSANISTFIGGLVGIWAGFTLSQRL